MPSSAVTASGTTSAPTTPYEPFESTEVEIPASLAEAAWPLPGRYAPAQATFEGFAYHLPGSHAAVALGVTEFLRHCRAKRLRCVRIVHGKGHGSRNREPVLKGKLRKWLSVRDEVLAFCQAPAAHGGGGALLVLLKNAR